ncbi:MAG: hypothetical protein EA366_01235 [Spirulina sp. DLM2.Bin59]|nr:MAG: hypothetical protein EA366_01235 [Spirulina sp. DLM2.Bin59]
MSKQTPGGLGLESGAIAAALAGTITAALTRQFLYAAAPLTLALGVNLFVHQRVRKQQQMLEAELEKLQQNLVAQVETDLKPVHQEELQPLRDRLLTLEQSQGELAPQFAHVTEQFTTERAADRQKLTDLASQLGQLQAQMQAPDPQREQLTATVTLLQHQIQELRERFSPEEFGMMQRVVEALKAQVQTLTDGETHHRQNSERAIAHLTEQIEHLNGITPDPALLMGLKTAVESQLPQALADLAARVTPMAAEIAHLKGLAIEPEVLTELQGAIANLQTHLAALPSPKNWQPEITDLQRAIQRIQDQVTALAEPPATEDLWDAATPEPAPVVPPPADHPEADFEEDFGEEDDLGDELDAEFEAFQAAERGGRPPDPDPLDKIGTELETGIRDLGENLWGWGRSLRNTLNRFTESVDFPYTDPESLQSWGCTATVRLVMPAQGPVAISGDGGSVAYRQSDGPVVIFDIETQGIHHSLVAPDCTALTFGSDAQTLILGQQTGQALVWREQRICHTLAGHGLPVTAIALSSHGRTCATASSDKTIVLWDLGTGHRLRTLTGHWATVESLAFSGDGHFLVSGSQDGTVKRWDVATGEKVANAAPGGEVQGVAMSPDGEQVASGGSDRHLRLWATNTLSPIHHHRTSGPIRQVQFSPDGLLIATISGKTVTLWAARPGGEARIARLHHPHSVHLCQFSHGGQQLLTVTAAGELSRWQKP